MSECKWTKGPWKVGDSADNGIPCVDGYAEGGGIFEICEVWGEENDTEETEMSIANAHLIAAAPDLYEALEAYHYHFGILEDNEFVNEEARRCCHLARAALTKARGES